MAQSHSQSNHQTMGRARTRYEYCMVRCPFSFLGPNATDFWMCIRVVLAFHCLFSLRCSAVARTEENRRLYTGGPTFFFSFWPSPPHRRTSFRHVAATPAAGRNRRRRTKRRKEKLTCPACLKRNTGGPTLSFVSRFGIPRTSIGQFHWNTHVLHSPGGFDTRSVLVSTTGWAIAFGTQQTQRMRHLSGLTTSGGPACRL